MPRRLNRSGNVSNQKVVIDIVAKTAEAVTGIGGIGGALGGVINPAEMLKKAIQKIVEVTKELVNAWAIQEAAEKKLEGVLRATAHSAGLSSRELKNMASAMQKVSVYGDDVVMGGQALLLTFKQIGRDTFPRATQAMVDMSAAMGQDMKSSAIQLGKALNDPITGLSALQRIGIQFTETQKEQVEAMMAVNDIAGAQALILSEVEGQMGGVAKEMASGTSGSIAKYNNAISDTKEVLGQLISMGLDPVRNMLTAMLTPLNDAMNATNNLRQAFIDLKNETSIETVTGTIEAMKGKIDANNVALEKKGVLWYYVGGLMRLQNKNYAEQITQLETANDILIKNKVILEQTIPVQMLLNGYNDVQIKQAEEKRKKAEAHAAAVEANIQFLKQQAAAIASILEGDKSPQQKLQDQIDLVEKAMYFWSTQTDNYKEAAKALAVLQGQLERLNEDKILTTGGGMAVGGGAGQGETSIGRINLDLWVEATNKAADAHRDAIFGMQDVEEEAHDNTMRMIKEEADARRDALAAGLEVTTAFADATISIMNSMHEMSRAEGIEALKQAKAIAIIEATINTAVAFTRALTSGGIVGPILAGLIAASGAAQIAAIVSQPIPAAAMGADFVTHGPQLLMVGDNAGGRERVSVTPIGSGGGGGNVIVNVQGSVITERQLALIVTKYQGQMIGAY